MTFYKENTFQSTSIGKIPKDWKVARLTEVADYINGYAFSPKDWKTEGLPIIRIQNLNDPTAEFNYFDGRIDERYFVKNGDLLFAWSASIGCYLWNRGDAWLNQHIFKVVPKQGVNREYLYYVLFKAIEQLKRRVHGSTMKHFRRRELKTTFIPLPPLLEQRAIVGVLGVVDSAVELVDKVIAKTERLKKGLMQTLLTRGIGHKEYKQTPIGTTPKTWKVVNVKDVCAVKGRIGWRGYRRSDFVDPGKGAISLGANNITEDNRLDLAELTYVSWEKYYESPEIHVKFGEIIIAQRGSLGKVAIIDKDIEKATINPNVVLLKNIKIDNFYLYYVLASPLTKKQILTFTSATTVPLLTQQQIKSLKIPLPPSNEQRKIAEILSNVDRKLELDRNEKAKLERIKRGLMDLLLTGKIRIKVNENEVI